MVEAGRVLLLDVDDGSAIAAVELDRVKRRKVLNVVCLAGHGLHRWLKPMIAGLRELAREQDCKAITARGRAGWRRVLRHYQFREVATLLELEVH